MEVKSYRGLTLVELLVVLLMVGLLASLAAPVVTGGLQRAREAALRENLYQMRRALDDFHADRGEYPQKLEDLVQERYLRKIPVDSLAQDAGGWDVVTIRSAGQPSVSASAVDVGGELRIYDVRSRATGQALDGTYYKDW